MNEIPPMRPARPSPVAPHRPAWRRVAAYGAAALALAAVFASYLRPDVVMALATRVWTCF